MKNFTMILMIGCIFCLGSTCFSRRKGQSSAPSETVSSISAVQYPAEVQIKVRGKVPCYKNDNNDCLVLQPIF